MFRTPFVSRKMYDAVLSDNLQLAGIVTRTKSEQAVLKSSVMAKEENTRTLQARLSASVTRSPLRDEVTGRFFSTKPKSGQSGLARDLTTGQFVKRT